MPTLLRQLQQARDHEPPLPASPVMDKGSSKSSSSSGRKVSRASQVRVEAHKEFLKVTSKGTRDEAYTNPESLPSLDDAHNNFQRIYPTFSETWAVDDLRDREYFHLEESGHVCMDYSGFGLFSYYQQVINKASSSFGLAYISANLPTHALYGAAEEGTAEAYIRKRVMDYLNVNDQEYSMVFTASRGSAFKLLAESYPFHLNQRLLTVYDFESEAVKWMAECAKKKGAKIMSARFKWPSLRVGNTDLKKQLQEKKKKGESAKGLFVFPLQSRMTGAKYSYQWMSQAQQNKWHVLLDASALGPKDMDSLGLSLFRPDFIVSSFYKVFGTDPTGFGCLFIKNSTVHSLHNSSRARAVGMVRIVSINDHPTDGPEGREGFQRSAWRLDQQQAGTSSFSGPVSSFYTEVDAKKVKSPVSLENNSRGGSKFPKSNGKRIGEIENSGYLRRVSEIEEEDLGRDGDSGRFSGRLGGYHSSSRGRTEATSEIEFSGQLTNSRHDLDSEWRGRAGEIEELVPNSGSLTRPRSSYGSSSGEIEEVIEKKPRKSLREQLHEPETSPLRTVSEILREDHDTPTTSTRFYTVPRRRSYSVDDYDDDYVLQTHVRNDRRAGDSDDSGGEEEYEDYRNSSYTYRNGRSIDQYDYSPDEMIPSGVALEDGFEESNFEPETSHIEEEIVEREFSRTALSDIEEEKSEGEGEGEDENDGDESDDGRGAEQNSNVEAADEKIAHSGELHAGGGGQAETSDNEEPKENLEGRTGIQQPPEVRTESRNFERQPVVQKEKRNVEGIKARLARFVGRASFRRHSGKSQFEKMEGTLEPKSDLPLYKRRAPIRQADFLARGASPVPEGKGSEVTNDRNGDVGSGGFSPGYPTADKLSGSAGPTSGSDSDDVPLGYKETARLGVEGTSSKGSKIVPASSDRLGGGDTEPTEQHSLRESPLVSNSGNASSSNGMDDDSAMTHEGGEPGMHTPDTEFGSSGIEKEGDEVLWRGQNDLRASGRWDAEQAGPASSSRECAMDDEPDTRPADSDVGDNSQPSSSASHGVRTAHSFPADGGGTPYESGEENYITILPGSRSGKNGDRIPEPVSESPDSTRQRDSTPFLEDSADTQSPAVEREMEKRESTASTPGEAAQSPEVRERPRSSGEDDLGELPDSSQSPRSEHEGKRVATSTPLHVKATPKISTSSYQTEKSNTEDLSFDEAEFHDAQDQRGTNGVSQDLRSGRTISRDVDFDDDMFTSSERRSTLAEDLARIDLEDSDDESYQYYRDSYHGSSTSGYFGDDVPTSARHEDGESDDDFEEGENGNLRPPRIVCKGLDLADSLGLTKTNYRSRYLVNWLVNSLLNLRHPSPNNQGIALVRIYGPKVKYDRGAAVAFNLVDWKGVFIQPGLVQRLADRSNISLGVGRLCNIVDPDVSPDFLAERERWCGSERSEHGKEGAPSCGGRSDGGKSSSAGKFDSLTIPVVTAALGFVTNFEDVYRLWAFVAKFLDADFVSKEVWRYHSLNQQTVVV